MMLRLLVITFFALIYSVSSFSQEKFDVLFMKDGSVINAHIVKEDSSRMLVRLVTGDTISIDYLLINKVIEDNISTKSIDDYIKRNAVKESSRFLNGSGFLVNFTQSTLIGSSVNGNSPFRTVGMGIDVGIGFWYGNRLYSGVGALAENSINGNSIFYTEHRFHVRKELNSAFFYGRAGYSMELASNGPAFNRFVSNYNYTGFRGIMAGGGVGYRLRLSDYLLMRVSAGFRYLNLNSTETWDDFSATTNAKVYRAKINIGLSF